jgi:hypothetical protein
MNSPATDNPAGRKSKRSNKTFFGKRFLCCLDSIPLYYRTNIAAKQLDFGAGNDKEEHALAPKTVWKISLLDSVRQ